MNIEVSANFKKMTSKAVISIVLFLIVYILLLLLGLGLTVLCAFGAFYIIVAKPSLITLGIGIGLVSLGFFIIAFLFKFIFKKHKTDLTHLTEITEEDEPKLFQFINEIVKEVGTDFPKKIYLSADVNASVFYDSSFWSMFFPIKKNLQIGLGLVNSTTEQEFKAIMAHEFGHFSQKSMKVGSYVYNVNEVIFNLLYENESFDAMIQKWANFSGYFSLFVAIALRIIQAIQWVLKKMYNFVNINYLALSREMEFHADEVAANVAGSDPLKESLSRLELANHSYNSVLSFYDDKISENRKSANMYSEQLFVLNFLAAEDEFPIVNNLPVVSTADLNKVVKSKLVITDQWSSHPSTKERASNLDRLNIKKESGVVKSANSLFSAIETIQEKLTDKLFSHIENVAQFTALPFEDFKTEYRQNFENATFDKIYNGYYDNKNPNSFDLDAAETLGTSYTFEDLFHKEKTNLVYAFIALENDQNTLSNIAQNLISLKTFDYDGQKFKANESSVLLPKLNEEKEAINVVITENDQAIYSYFFHLAKKEGMEQVLKGKYETYFSQDKLRDEKYQLYFDLLSGTEFISVVTPLAKIRANFNALKLDETKLKEAISIMLKDNLYEADLTDAIKENFQLYLKEDWVYFENDVYIDVELQILLKAMHDYAYLLGRGYFLLKQDLLRFQSELVQKPEYSA